MQLAPPSSYTRSHTPHPGTRRIKEATQCTRGWAERKRAQLCARDAPPHGDFTPVFNWPRHRSAARATWCALALGGQVGGGFNPTSHDALAFFVAPPIRSIGMEASSCKDAFINEQTVVTRARNSTGRSAPSCIKLYLVRAGRGSPTGQVWSRFTSLSARPPPPSETP